VLTCVKRMNMTLPCIYLRSTRCLVNTDVDRVLKKITRSGDVLILLLMLRPDDRADRLDKSFPMIQGSFSWTLQTSKYFKLPNFSLLDPALGLRGWLK
jgi:hypothetical protein